jgi:predicted nucleic acid-binding protein
MKIFWDTNLFIYLWEDSPRQGDMQAFSRAIIEGEHTVMTSTLTVGEILVRPARQGDAAILETYLAAFQSIPLLPFDLVAARRFAQLRAQNGALRAPDAIQLACASSVGTDLFVTNDARLCALEIPGIKRIAALSNWRKEMGA